MTRAQAIISVIVIQLIIIGANFIFYGVYKLFFTVSTNTLFFVVTLFNYNRIKKSNKSFLYYCDFNLSLIKKSHESFKTFGGDPVEVENQEKIICELEKEIRTQKRNDKIFLRLHIVFLFALALSIIAGLIVLLT